MFILKANLPEYQHRNIIIIIIIFFPLIRAGILVLHNPQHLSVAIGTGKFFSIKMFNMWMFMITYTSDALCACKFY